MHSQSTGYQETQRVGVILRQDREEAGGFSYRPRWTTIIHWYQREFTKVSSNTGMCHALTNEYSAAQLMRDSVGSMPEHDQLRVHYNLTVLMGKLSATQSFTGNTNSEL